jgi:EAL domain-containing protein (putative c-di-GMP-specific phosphodiesterase class I)
MSQHCLLDLLLEPGSLSVLFQPILESISSLARKVGSRVVAEGVTNTADLDVISAIGIELVQGYLFYPALPLPELAEMPFLSGRPVFPPLAGTSQTASA